MTITLSPQQEEAIRNAIRNGQITSVEDFIDQAIAGLCSQSETHDASFSEDVPNQGLGMFSSPEDAALLDEVVSMAYEERRRPSKRESNL